MVVFQLRQQISKIKRLATVANGQAPILPGPCATRAITVNFYTIAIPNYCIQLTSHLASWYQTDALLRAGKTELAVSDTQYFGRIIGESRRYRIPHVRSLAVLAMRAQDIEKAITLLQDAEKLTAEIGLPGEELSIQVALVKIYQQQGKESQAQPAFARATELAQSLASNIADEQERIQFLSKITL